MTRPLLAILLLFAGCAGREAPYVVNWSDFDREGVKRWTAQIAEREPRGATILFCHGVDQEGPWTLATQPYRVDLDAYTVGYTLLKIRKRPVYFVCCNPYGVDIPLHGVFYAKNLVWQECRGTGNGWVRVGPDSLVVRYGIGSAWDLVEGRN